MQYKSTPPFRVEESIKAGNNGIKVGFSGLLLQVAG